MALFFSSLADCLHTKICWLVLFSPAGKKSINSDFNKPRWTPYSEVVCLAVYLMARWLQFECATSNYSTAGFLCPQCSWDWTWTGAFRLVLKTSRYDSAARSRRHKSDINKSAASCKPASCHVLKKGLIFKGTAHAVMTSRRVFPHVFLIDRSWCESN